MSSYSVLNDVLGPVMRGPSSSHSAGAHRIALLARDLLGDAPARARFVFDPEGSYAPTYQICGVDLALAWGLLGRSMTEDGFFGALEAARAQAMHTEFAVEPLTRADHPNFVHMALGSVDRGGLEIEAKSTGGGGVTIDRVDGWQVALDGRAHHVLVECEPSTLGEVRSSLTSGLELLHDRDAGRVLAVASLKKAPDDLASLRRLPGVAWVRHTRPVFMVPKGNGLIDDGDALTSTARELGCTLGQAVLAHETSLLDLTEDEVIDEILARYQVMCRSVESGLAEAEVDMPLLTPTAHTLLHAERQGRTVLGGPHTRAAARALAATHVNNSMGVVCAAPTGGSAGTLPGVFVTYEEERQPSPRALALGLLAAGGVGLALAAQGTFAAETAGCQVEIGAAGAMAAAGLVEMSGGDAETACNAAAIAFQNVMGLVCDPVQGGCEIPCHTRNAVAASGAFICADLALGGYRNPIPLGETIDAIMSVGEAMPPELRCTARGGIAATPSARALPRRR
jgi:L-serine dehydratase